MRDGGRGEALDGETLRRAVDLRGIDQIRATEPRRKLRQRAHVPVLTERVLDRHHVLLVLARLGAPANLAAVFGRGVERPLVLVPREPEPTRGELAKVKDEIERVVVAAPRHRARLDHREHGDARERPVRHAAVRQQVVTREWVESHAAEPFDAILEKVGESEPERLVPVERVLDHLRRREVGLEVVAEAGLIAPDHVGVRRGVDVVSDEV